MKKKNIFKPMDAEERELMESIEADEWKPVADGDKAREEAMQAARNALRKDKRVNLRLSQKDYQQIKVRAVEDGIPYQTLISSIVHKYLNGTLRAE